jgi:two-component system LytT family response regulator
VSSKSLGHYEDLLKEKSFIRTHHSFLINKKHITGYQNDGVINLAGNVNVPLGDAYRKCFMYFFKKC